MKNFSLRVAVVLFITAHSASAQQSEPLADLTPPEAQARELATLRTVADLALLPPRLNTNPLPKYAVENLSYGMTIGIERTPKGRLFAAWIGGADGPDAYMLVAKSDDAGQTWSEPILVIDSQADHLPIPRTVIVGNLWTDPLGRLWLFFDQTMNHYDGRGGLWVTRCDNPDADTLAWNKPYRLWHGSMLNKPLVRSNGEWVLSVQLLQRTGIGPFSVGVFPELDPLRGVNTFVSTDNGESWENRGRVTFPNPSWHEPMAVERNDGSLWMLARTRKGPMLTTSVDGGSTWSEPKFPPGIRHPAARFHLRKLASGRWLLVKHGQKIDSHTGRSHLTAWLSDDEGDTWHGGLLLDEREGLSYPDGFQAPDGAIYISYDWQRATKGHILFARFTEHDVDAGKLVSKGSALRRTIIKPGKLNPPSVDR